MNREERTSVAKGGSNLEDKVNAFLKELAEPYKEVPSDAIIDTDDGRQWQYEDVPEQLEKFIGYPTNSLIRRYLKELS